MRLRSLFLTAAVATSVLGVTACGSDSASSSGSATTTAAATAGEFNDADVTFLQSMIPHHEQAVAMAEMAFDPKMKAGSQVVALAKRVQAAQDPEITQMKQWLTTWGKPTQMATSGGHDMSKMSGMMSDADMTSLSGASAAAFDEMWLRMMVEHHQGAIEMAETVKSDGKNPDVAKLADQIIAAQQAEITEMNTLLKK